MSNQARNRRVVFFRDYTLLQASRLEVGATGIRGFAQAEAYGSGGEFGSIPQGEVGNAHPDTVAMTIRRTE